MENYFRPPVCLEAVKQEMVITRQSELVLNQVYSVNLCLMLVLVTLISHTVPRILFVYLVKDQSCKIFLLTSHGSSMDMLMVFLSPLL